MTRVFFVWSLCNYFVMVTMESFLKMARIFFLLNIYRDKNLQVTAKVTPERYGFEREFLLTCEFILSGYSA